MKYKTTEELEAARLIISPPGDTILETLEHKGISLKAFAEAMGITLEAAGGLIKGDSPITQELAIQLEKVLAVPASFWMERERNYRKELDWIKKSKNL
jgi:HTH-type transcriptional regulator/antitoxin HigA